MSVANTQEPTCTVCGIAVLNGQVVAFPVDTWWFEWGPTTAYGNTTPRLLVEGARDVQATIRGLTAGDTYHFKTVTGSGAVGGDVSFTEGDCQASLLVEVALS